MRKKSVFTEERKQKIRMAHLGKHRSEETKQKLRLANLGKRLTDEHKMKISNSLKGCFVPMETRKKISATLTGKKKSPEFCEKIRKARLHIIIPYKDTKIEKRLQQALKQSGVCFTTHKPIFGQPDLFIEPNLCVFVDGCYWHVCELCIPPKDYPKNWEAKQFRDREVNKRLKDEGYSVLRFWQHDINTRLDFCLNTIQEKIKGRWDS